jgi:branched-chain amino acid transport system substrate-binding protein|tara:strand:+ start:736 stop:1911 length:1176 start_codon:yes stop_codon:yes gene_type:complete
MSVKRLLAAGLAITSLLAVWTAPAMAEDFVIGAVSARTGFMAAYDAPFMQGVNMYAEEANKRGGLLGKYPVKVIERDDTSDPQKAAIAVAALLKKEKLNAFISSAISPAAIAAGNMVKKKNLLIMHTIASQPTIPVRAGGGSYLVMMSDAHMGGVYAKFARHDLKAKTAYIITSDFDPYTEFLPLYFKDLFEKLGGKVIGQSTFAYDQQEFSKVVTAIRKMPSEPDVIVGMPFDNDFPIFINQLRAGGVKSTYLGPDVLDQPSVKGLGKVVEGVHYVTMAAPSASAAAGAFVKAYEAKFGNADAYYPAMVGYSAMRLVEAAVKAAGGTDAKAVRDAFGQLANVQTEIGTVTFRGVGKAPNLPVHVMRIEGGKGKYLKSIKLDPAEIPTARK